MIDTLIILHEFSKIRLDWFYCGLVVKGLTSIWPIWKNNVFKRDQSQGFMDGQIFIGFQKLHFIMYIVFSMVDFFMIKTLLL